MMERAPSRPEAAKATFVEAAQTLRLWADATTTERGSPEWETNYEAWPELTRAYADVLDVCSPNDWDRELIDLLLYTLARDNEAEVVKDELVLRPDQLLALSRAAALGAEADAKWQLADALGRTAASDADVEPLLERFLQDTDEYVSRRALSALASRGAAQFDDWAVRAWETDHQYQRMAALDALAQRNSPLLGRYLGLAEADGREHLVGLAKDIRSRRAGR